ncbi:hypothetical protein THRCLA_00855 [Thraustotheca clavata]|uniref:RCC1-like domain-containing protein n=1 Tax=Thraustotheca clavata TaxID=74557 RepID=A0A1W0AAB9_9STRA|nr:hypothetical protein THRCLA_00855 [Thraustotheca clavata]
MISYLASTKPAPVLSPRRSYRNSEECRVVVSIPNVRLRRGSEITYQLSLTKPPFPHQCVIVSISPPNIQGLIVSPTEVIFKPVNSKQVHEISLQASETMELLRFRIEHRVKRTKHCDLRFTKFPVNYTSVQILRKDSLFVFAFGSNIHGRLGTVAQGAAMTPTPLRCKWLFPVHISCGGAHSAIIDINSHLYCFGRGTEGQLAQPHIDHIKAPTIVAALAHHQVARVACGSNHTLCIINGGKVFSWGDNSYGQLGVGLKSKHYHVPLQVDKLRCSAISVICGGNQSFVISQLRQVYAAGCNLAGQLGIGDMISRNSFTRSSFLSQVEGLATGPYHTIAFTISHQVFVWGNSANGRLGLDSIDFYLEPQQLEMFHDIRVKQVAAGGMHTALLTQGGDLLMWGGNNYGQVGDGTTVDRLQPIRLRIFKGNSVKSIALGEWHSVALADDGCVYAWGFGEEGQLGLGDDRNIHLPMVVHTLSGTAPLRIECGFVHTFAITSIEIANPAQQAKDREISERSMALERRRLTNRKSMMWKGKHSSVRSKHHEELAAIPTELENDPVYTSPDSILHHLEEKMASTTISPIPKPKPPPPRRPQTARLYKEMRIVDTRSWRERPLTSRTALRTALRQFSISFKSYILEEVQPSMERTIMYPRLQQREKIMQQEPLDPFDPALMDSISIKPPLRPQTAPLKRSDTLDMKLHMPRVNSVTAFLNDEMDASDSSEQELHDGLAIGWEVDSNDVM